MNIINHHLYFPDLATSRHRCLPTPACGTSRGEGLALFLAVNVCRISLTHAFAREKKKLRKMFLGVFPTRRDSNPGTNTLEDFEVNH